MANMNLYQRVCLVVVLLAAMAVASSAQTFTTLFSFDFSDGAQPTFPSLVQGLDGNLYGTTSRGGPDSGTTFRITPAGTLTTVYSFCTKRNCPDGSSPEAGVVQGADGNFYGTTASGGSTGFGTVFTITPEGRRTTLYSFCAHTNCTDGEEPLAGVIQAGNGNFYGTTRDGGTGWGTVFSIVEGTLVTRHNFCAKPLCGDGSYPVAGLVQGIDANFYGTTSRGGGHNAGTVFKMTPDGVLRTLHSFDTADGAYPEAALIQGADGNFYGTTSAGAAGNAGTVFRITPEGVLTTLYSFCSQPDCADGGSPLAGLVQATDGNFYGTTSISSGGPNGTIFQITPAGTMTTLYTFCSQAGCADGAQPLAGLIQATDGNFYGATALGGEPNSYGTIFSLAMGLGPFVETPRAFGSVGGSVYILGTNLTGATSVSFNGTAATFTVVSATEITTTVPTGATSGFVTVTTPSGTLTSNKQFRVSP